MQTILDVNYESQLQAGATAWGDCGPISNYMIARTFGIRTTIDAIERSMGLGDIYKSATVEQVKQGLTFLKIPFAHRKGMTFEEVAGFIEKGFCIESLLWYPFLPYTLQYDPSYDGGHYVVITGVDREKGLLFYNDPYWAKAEDGQHISIKWTDFYKAWNFTLSGYNLSARTGLVIQKSVPFLYNVAGAIVDIRWRIEESVRLMEKGALHLSSGELELGKQAYQTAENLLETFTIPAMYGLENRAKKGQL